MKGIFVPNPGTVLKDNKFAVDSSKNALKLDVNSPITHFDYFEHTFKNNPAVGEHIVKSVEHNLGYVPFVLAYFRSLDLSSFFVLADTYQLGALRGFSFNQELVYYSTNKSVDFCYKVSSGGPSVDMTGITIGFKYMIFSNEVKSS